jgi:hypothetical protein
MQVFRGAVIPSVTGRSRSPPPPPPRAAGEFRSSAFIYFSLDTLCRPRADHPSRWKTTAGLWSLSGPGRWTTTVLIMDTPTRDGDSALPHVYVHPREIVIMSDVGSLK